MEEAHGAVLILRPQGGRRPRPPDLLFTEQLHPTAGRCNISD